MTAQGSVQVAVEAVSRGASDFIGKPFDISAVVDLLRRQLEARREADAVPAVRAGSAAQPGRPGGPQRAHDHGLQADRAGRAHRSHGADHGRIRHRQGTGGARHPRFQLAPVAPLPQRELLRPHRYAAGGRTFRPHARRLYRRHRGTRGPFRSGRRRHALPGRTGLHQPRVSGEPAARVAERRSAARRLHPIAPRERARDRRQQRSAARPGGRRQFPRRSVLPPERA